MTYTNASKTQFVCVRISAGGLGTFAYTNAEAEAITPLGSFDLIEPTMVARLPRNSVEFSSDPCRVELPWRADTFVDYATDGYPLPKTTIEVFEYFSDTGQVTKLFRGYLSDAESDIEADRRVVRLNAVWTKNYIRTNPCDRATEYCSNTFGDRRCQKSLAGLVGGISQGITIQKIEQNTVTVSGLGEATIAHNEHFLRGYLYCLGVPIDIAQWVPARPTEFVLLDRPSPRWAGQLCSIHPGCSYLFGSCALWNNTQNFNGIGVRMAWTNPYFEEI